EELLQYVERPARYIGGEINSIVKDWESADLKVALAFPDIYDIGMSHLGIKILYHLLNSRDNILCERAFAPWHDMEKLLRSENLPLVSLENNKPLSEFDIVGFSLAHELNYTNLLNMLDMSGIPLKTQDRNESHPLIIAGGPSAFNPEPMADFIDLFLIGDGEEAVLEIAEKYIAAKKAGKGARKDLLREFAGIEGVYIPGFYKASYKEGIFSELISLEKDAPLFIKKRTSKDLEKCFYPARQIVSYIPLVHDRISLEIMRGCPHSCRFCQATTIYSPLRLRSKDSILEICSKTYSFTGHDEISLLSLSTGDYPGIADLAAKLVSRFKSQGVSISFPSLRVEDSIKSLPSIIQKIKKTGLTFAPEAASARLRKFINKNIDIEKLLSAAKRSRELGWRKIKLYFMIGLPGETDADIDAITELAYEILGQRDKGGMSFLEIVLSVSSFIPKAHTAFQWEAIAPKEDLMGKISRLRRNIRTKKIKLNTHGVDMSVLEALFSRGDRRLAFLVESAFKKGARFDNWKDIFDNNTWQSAIRECGVDVEAYLKERSYSEPLAWDHISSGISKEALIKDSILAHKDTGSLACAP
ncbi:MAG: TIGR03960 family B12-binding radical SAM protein, partial [Candidatus Omnitrophica bacterium]|nr:TIGR03960 family B12-binding radical SAM protein [Candidatus Omnitrophota bacterium]